MEVSKASAKADMQRTEKSDAVKKSRAPAPNVDTLETSETTTCWQRCEEWFSSAWQKCKELASSFWHWLKSLLPCESCHKDEKKDLEPQLKEIQAFFDLICEDESQEAAIKAQFGTLSPESQETIKRMLAQELKVTDAEEPEKTARLTSALTDDFKLDLFGRAVASALHDLRTQIQSKH